MARPVPPLQARVVVRPVVGGERETLLRIEWLEASVRLRALDARIGSEDFFEGEKGKRRSDCDPKQIYSSFSAAATSVAAARLAGREAAASVARRTRPSPAARKPHGVCIAIVQPNDWRVMTCTRPSDIARPASAPRPAPRPPIAAAS